MGSQVTAARRPLPDGAELVTEPDMMIAAISAAPTAEQLGARPSPRRREEPGGGLTEEPAGCGALDAARIAGAVVAAG